MKFVGVDLHKRTLSVCVLDAGRNVLDSVRISGAAGDEVQRFFGDLGTFPVVLVFLSGKAATFFP